MKNYLYLIFEIFNFFCRIQPTHIDIGRGGDTGDGWGQTEDEDVNEMSSFIFNEMYSFWR